jgi:hypothetical protein
MTPVGILLRNKWGLLNITAKSGELNKLNTCNTFFKVIKCQNLRRLRKQEIWT